MDLKDIIRVPYSTRPHMVKNPQAVYNSQPDPELLSLKTQQIELYGSALYGVTAEASESKLVSKVSEFLGLESTNDIVNLSLKFEEDLAIMTQGTLAAICFCFPSGWVPGSRLGQSLQQIHEPVADGQQLRQASQKLSATLGAHDSFRRTVWTVTAVPDLNNLPQITQSYQSRPLDLDNLYFRTETQTTLPWPEHESFLFFVKVSVQPLKSLWCQHRDLILSGINSMTQSVLIYKKLADIKHYLNAL